MSLGAKLVDPEEALFRQVHPSWIQAGRPSSQAFRPTAKDEGLLSVSQGAKTSAREAFELYTQKRGLESIGVWVIRVADCSEVKLDVYDDPLTEPVPDLAHAVVDFRALDEKVVRVKAQMLKAKAEPVFANKTNEHEP